MISNAEIKRVKALQSKKFRDESGLFVVEGEKMVAEALESGLQVEAVYRRDEIGEQAMARICPSTTRAQGDASGRRSPKEPASMV